MTLGSAATWAICAAAVVGVVARPFRWPEAIWAVAGAVALVAAGLVPPGAALAAVGAGADVYLFLIGMMLLTETARTHGLFDWVAATAAIHARGSSPRLFLLIYAAGVVTTAFLSNDATAVVLTPAVCAAARRAEAEPLPLLFACALVANAASFVLPISNPANIVLYGGALPALGPWLASFALPSVAAIVVTFVMLRRVERRRIEGACAAAIARDPLSAAGRAALTGIVGTAIVLLAASALDVRLGAPTALAGLATLAGVSALAGRPVAAPLRAIAWGVIPLVAGLFVLVEALTLTGVTGQVAGLLRAAAADPARGAAIAGTALAFAANAVNNLPAGLLAGIAVEQARPPRIVVDALLIGVDLGPNLSITGSLATILWLQAIRREGHDVTFRQFLAVGAATMLPALAAALGVRLMLG